MTAAGDRSACADPELLNALLDHELDAARAIGVERHLARCASCAAAFARLEDISRSVRNPGVRYDLPEGFRDRIQDALAAAVRQAALPEPVAASPPWTRRVARRRFFLPSFAPAAALAVAAGIAAFVVLPRTDRDHPAALMDQLVAGHIRSLMANHLTDVTASDQHAVKPWFQGKLDFAPPVIDLADQAFALAGGRLDYIGGRAVAALIYRRRAHVINVFIWPGRATSPGALTHDGFNMVEWRAGDLTFWAVSDLNLKELQEFSAVFRERTPT